MIKINIETLLKERKRSKYWLCQRMYMTSRNLNKIIQGKTSSISFKYIEGFCKFLECEPGELISVEFDQEENNNLMEV